MFLLDEQTRAQPSTQRPNGQAAGVRILSRAITSGHLTAGLLFIVPLLVYVSLIGRWSLAGDEIYTFKDSSLPAWEILTDNQKPIYYLICHYAMKLPFPLEVSMRLPAAVAAALVPPVFFLMLRTRHNGRLALYAAILVGLNPWLFELSQFARFYTLMFLLASLATLSLYRWLHDRATRWLVMYVVASLLAILTHTTAAVLLPAGIIALVVAGLRQSPQSRRQIIRVSGWAAIALAVLLVPLTLVYLRPIFMRWLSTNPGNYGDYTVPQLLAAAAISGGLQVWALAVLPLFRRPSAWSADDLFLLLMVGLGMLPFLLLVYAGGGGISSRYLLASLPGLFVLAARSWHHIARQVESASLRGALGAAMLAFYVPYLMSTLQDGNHYPYREAAALVESLPLEKPIIAATTHAMYMHYASSDEPVHELDSLLLISGDSSGRNCHAARMIARLTDEAARTGRPLLLVSRENQKPLDAFAARMLAEQFAVVATLERPRFDHRRNRLVIYEYRPREKQ